MEVLNAKVNRSGDFVVCGMPACGFRFGPVAVAEDTIAIRTGGEKIRRTYFVLGAGWKVEEEADGTRTWRMTEYARRRAKQGQRPKFRRARLDVGEERAGVTPRFHMRQSEHVFAPREDDRIVCPLCGMKQGLAGVGVAPGLVILAIG